MNTNKKYWLNGIYIALSIYFIVSGLYFLIPSLGNFSLGALSLGEVWLILSIILSFPFGGRAFLPNDAPMNLGVGFLIAFLSFVCIGAIIGWIYGRIKK